MDESAISTVPNRIPKVISPKGKRHVAKVVSAERGQTVTVVCCFSPTGIFIPPAIIFPRKRMNVQLYQDAPEGTLPLISDSGYMNTELFLDWLKHFEQFVKPSEEDPVLLIMDNHISHCSLDAVMFCRDKFITLLTLPPHASHMLQPLDKGFFGPLKSAFSTECDKWMFNHPGRAITLKDLSSLFRSAYERVATLEKANHSFKATGIYPYNPDVFSDEDFEPSAVTSRPPPSEEPEENNVIADMPNAEDKEIVSPSTLLPLPKATHEEKRKRKGKKSEVMTGSSFKNALMASTSSASEKGRKSSKSTKKEKAF
ncbi:uncharacterized protein [Anabrus simplex]|uniref:uncharacterized protein n=1 Tax=Anabrus simplex TaxID=316456 RepID=UPI0035A37320